MSGFGCHNKGVYMGALSYADDITIMCPSNEGGGGGGVTEQNTKDLL